MNTIKTNDNPVLKTIATLIRKIRQASPEQRTQAVERLQEFSDAWLVSGDMANLEGAGDCSLVDTDTTNAIKEIIETVWQDQE